jgi:hypothetical protein
MLFLGARPRTSPHRVVRNLQEISGGTGGVEQLDRSGAEMEGKAKSACRALSDLIADSLEEPAGLDKRSSGHQDDELIVRIAGYHVRLAGVGAQNPGHQHESFLSHPVSVHMVQHLKLVYFEENEYEIITRRPRLLERLVQPGIEVRTAEDPGQGINVRLSRMTIDRWWRLHHDRIVRRTADDRPLASLRM